MNILHNLWNIVSTEDENLMKYMLVVLGIVEAYVTMKFFTTFLSIEYTKKQRNIYLIIMELVMILSTFFAPKQFALFVHLILTFLIIKFVFKISFVKSLLAEIVPMLLTVLLETVYVKLCLNLFGISITDCANIIIYRIPYMLFNYLTIYLIAKYVKFIKINLTSFDNINKNQRK